MLKEAEEEVNRKIKVLKDDKIVQNNMIWSVRGDTVVKCF